MFLKKTYIFNLQNLMAKIYLRSFITHTEIMNGGVLEFEMGNQPNKKLWTEPESFPPSMTEIEIKY